MTDKETYCSEELERCRANIEKTKGKIEFHKDMLKKLEHKEMELLIKLEKIKLEDLKSLISKHGYNIDDLREAMTIGDFSGVIPQNIEKDETENPTPDVSSEQEDNTQLDGDSEPSDKNQQSEKDNKF